MVYGCSKWRNEQKGNSQGHLWVGSTYWGQCATSVSPATSFRAKAWHLSSLSSVFFVLIYWAPNSETETSLQVFYSMFQIQTIKFCCINFVVNFSSRKPFAQELLMSFGCEFSSFWNAFLFSCMKSIYIMCSQDAILFSILFQIHLNSTVGWTLLYREWVTSSPTHDFNQKFLISAKKRIVNLRMVWSPFFMGQTARLISSNQGVDGEGLHIDEC